MRQLNCCAALRTKQDVDPNVFFGSSLSFNLYTLLSTRSAAVKKRKLRTIKVAATFCVNAHSTFAKIRLLLMSLWGLVVVDYNCTTVSLFDGSCQVLNIPFL